MQLDEQRQLRICSGDMIISPLNMHAIVIETCMSREKFLLGNFRNCHLTNVLYENVTFMRLWMDSSTWEESVRHLEESMNEELTRVLSNVEESIPDASHASPDASYAFPTHPMPSPTHPMPPRRISCIQTHPMWRSPSTDT
ncbi:hypothetical protein Hanom_Chr11g01009561 [Helianthus anomalus]